MMEAKHDSKENKRHSTGKGVERKDEWLSNNTLQSYRHTKTSSNHVDAVAGFRKYKMHHRLQ
jgi:hypothetical protein